MNLDIMFSPKSIAIIGASRKEGSVGYDILKNLVMGCVFECEFCRPFIGKIYPINPNADEILGKKCYKKISDVAGEIDLAVIVVHASIVKDIAKECIKKKVKSIIIISAGFAEMGEKLKRLQEEITEMLAKAKIPMLGPNCLGLIRPSTGVNASFAPAMPKEGDIAFISQSGALVDSVIDWSIENNYGFSAIVSVGNQAMLGINEFLEYFANDSKTKAITLYIEGIDDGRKFMEIAKKVSAKKPIIAIKAGRTEQGTHAIASHTGSLAGNYKIYETAFRQSNVFIADNLEELFDKAKALATQPVLKGSVAIVTNGGGAGVLCTDYAAHFNLPLVELKESTLKKLDASGKMHDAYSRRNPLDIIGDANSERYKTAVSILLKENYIAGLIVIVTLQSTTDIENIAKEIIDEKNKNPSKPILLVCMMGRFTKKAIKLLEENKIPVYNDMKRAVFAMKSLQKREIQLNSKS